MSFIRATTGNRVLVDESSVGAAVQTFDLTNIFDSTYDRYDRVVKADIIGQLKNIDGVDSVNLEFVSKDNEDYHRDGALLSSNKVTVSQNTYVETSINPNDDIDYYLANSITINGFPSSSIFNPVLKSAVEYIDVYFPFFLFKWLSYRGVEQ